MCVDGVQKNLIVPVCDWLFSSSRWPVHLQKWTQKPYHILACVGCQSDASPHINHFSDCQQNFMEMITAQMATTIQNNLFSFASSTWQPTVQECTCGDHEISTSLSSLQCSTGVKFLQMCSVGCSLYSVYTAYSGPLQWDLLNWSNVPAQRQEGSW